MNTCGTKCHIDMLCSDAIWHVLYRMCRHEGSCTALICKRLAIDGCSGAIRARDVSRGKLLTARNARTVIVRNISRSKLLSTGNARLDFESVACRPCWTASPSATTTEFNRDGDGSRDMGVREIAGATGFGHTRRALRWVTQHWAPLSSVTEPSESESSHEDLPPPEADDGLETRDFERFRRSRRLCPADPPPLCRTISGGRRLRRTCGRTGSWNCGSTCLASRTGTPYSC